MLTLAAFAFALVVLAFGFVEGLSQILEDRKAGRWSREKIEKNA